MTDNDNTTKCHMHNNNRPTIWCDMSSSNPDDDVKDHQNVHDAHDGVDYFGCLTVLFGLIGWRTQAF